MILAAMQNNAFDGRGIDAIKTKLDEISKMFTALEFRMVSIKE